MSARAKLFALMRNNSRLAESVVDEIFNTHAHELAEKIRERSGQYVGGAFDGALAAADLIDPEAK